MHGLAFSQVELRRLFIEAEVRYRPPPVSHQAELVPYESSSSSGLDWVGMNRREEHQRIFDMWEQWENRLLPSPEMLHGFLDQILMELEEPVEDVGSVEPARTSRRRKIDEVLGSDSDEKPNTRGRPRSRL